jgi:hypothetical protein
MDTFGCFLSDAVKSGLASREQLAEAEAAVRAELSASAPAETRLNRLIQVAIERQILTAWQCEKLKQRQYKGFFQHHYKLLNWIASSRTLSRYVAEDIESGAIVELIVVQGSYVVIRKDSFIAEGIAR